MRPARWWRSTATTARPRSRPTGEDRWNIVVWLDHRALAEAEECSATGHPVLDFVGGTMSPEMEIPKLMWLKRHLRRQWQRYGRLMDLADWLTFRASGSNARSVCTLTCKWTYLAHETPGWQADFLRRVGLDDLSRRAALPPAASADRDPLGGLGPAAAGELGLTADCQVGCGLIDAHAGALGALGGVLGQGAATLDRHIAHDRRHLDLPHGALARAARGAGRVGPLLRRGGARLVAQRGRPVGDRRLLDHILAWHAEGRALGKDATPASCGGSASCAPRTARTSPAACTSCPTSTATARRSPTRMRWA